MEKAIYSKEYREIVRRLRKARLEAGLTQEQAAHKLGRTQCYLSKVEHGDLRVDVVGLKQFAKLYGKKVDYFF